MTRAELRTGLTRTEGAQVVWFSTSLPQGKPLRWPMPGQLGKPPDLSITTTVASGNHVIVKWEFD